MPKPHMRIFAALAAALLAGSAIAEDRHESHSHRFAGDVDAFHSVLAPLWHAPAGKERSLNVCARAQKLESLATAIRSADPQPLLASIASLRARCRSGAEDIDAAFFLVHEAFHRLIESGAK